MALLQLTVIVVFLLAPVMCVPVDERVGNLTTDLYELMNLFGGDYDNLAQYKSDIAKGLPPNETHLHLHAKYFETIIPALAKDYNVFYVQEHENGDPTQVYSQSINFFYINMTTWTIGMRIYKFVNPETAKKYLNAWENPGIFDQLKFSDLTYNDSCGLSWKKLEPQHFFGKMTFGTCVLPYKATQIIIYYETHLLKPYLTAHQWWYVQSNGTEILGKLSPYNETRQTPPPRSHASAAVLPVS